MPTNCVLFVFGAQQTKEEEKNCKITQEFQSRPKIQPTKIFRLLYSLSADFVARLRNV